MFETGGVCVGLVVGWAMSGMAGATIRSLGTLAGWAVAAAALLALHPALPPIALAAGAGAGAVARLVLLGWAIRERRA